MDRWNGPNLSKMRQNLKFIHLKYGLTTVNDVVFHIKSKISFCTDLKLLPCSGHIIDMDRQGGSYSIIYHLNVEDLTF